MTSISKDDLLADIVLFVGAGISVPAGLPAFEQLRAELFDQIVQWAWMAPGTRRRIAARLRALAPEYAVSLLDDDDRGPREYICQRLQGATPSAEHKLLAVALRHGAQVYTPNFDSLIETAVGDEAAVAVRHSENDVPGNARLLKLHGSCPDIIVRAEEVMVSLSGPWADRFLIDCSGTKSHLVVWGYRGADPDLAPLVLSGARAASGCTWIAFSDDDAARATALLSGIEQARVVSAESQTSKARKLAAAIVDRTGLVDLADGDFGSRRHPAPVHYVVQRPATRARALGHLGGPRIGRRAWWGALLSGDRSAVRPLSRSYLFDSRLVQTAVLTTVPLVASRSTSGEIWNAILTAAEGRGARPGDDRLIHGLNLMRNRIHETEAGAETELLAREVSIMRRRGRLLDADKALNALEESIRRRAEEVSATWRGRLLYERTIILRLRGETESARRQLASIDTESAAIVGANWSMWLEDEKCALSIWTEEVDAAEGHLARARELASAYGEHRLATVDLAVRALQLNVIKGESQTKMRQEVRRVQLAALRFGVLTPMRRAWLDGAVGDSARRSGDIETALRAYGRLRRSPHLVHPLAGALGFLVCGRSLPTVDIEELVEATGSNSTARLIERWSSSPSADLSADQWAQRLLAGRGFVFLS